MFEQDEDREARAFQIARELIAEHGCNVGAFLQDKIDILMASDDHDQLLTWFTIRNAVGITLANSSTHH